MAGSSHIKFCQVNKTDTGLPQNPEASETLKFQNYIEVTYTDLHNKTWKTCNKQFGFFPLREGVKPSWLIK